MKINTNHPICPQSLTSKDLLQLKEQGYLAFRDVLSPAEVEAARTGLHDLTKQLAFGSPDRVSFSPGKTGNFPSAASFQFQDSRCFMDLESGFDPRGKSLKSIELNVRKYMHFTQAHPALASVVAAGNRLRSIVDSILGEDPILFQEMALVKPPHGGREKPWHQDNAYFSVAPLEAVLGTWIALDDATVENGCMHVIPGGQHIGALKHFHGSDCEIIHDRLDTSKAVAVPIPAGGAMFFYGLLPHETPTNHSPDRRRALQFHYRSASSQIVDADTYNRIFAESDGTPASCKAALT